MTIVIFCICYIFIILEHPLKISKSATALFLGFTLWGIGFLQGVPVEGFLHSLQESSEILFFILAAMLLVEVIYSHKGFDILVKPLYSPSKKITFIKFAFATFFLSSVLDNLTTTIVMVTLVRAIYSIKEERLLVVGALILGANFGGVWSPIGDITTTMLWLGGQISAEEIIHKVFLPAFLGYSFVVATLLFFIKGNFEEKRLEESFNAKKDVLLLGLLALITVPFYKVLWSIRPIVGLFFNLSLMWIYLEIKARKEDSSYIRVGTLFKKIDIEGIFFFFGLLLGVSFLKEAGYLKILTENLQLYIGNEKIIAIIMGFLSSIVDNVPLTALVQKMYPLSLYPQDHSFWEFITLSVGIGGNLLVIGSAAGVIAMNMEKIDFFWYLKKITPIAFLSYVLTLFFYVMFNHFY
jgi:Na+/H+ antiporter NhaD/arsenite permease-like protein